MAKTIKLEDDTYEKLNRFRGKDETRSQAVDRLLTIDESIKRLNQIIADQADARQQRLQELKRG